MRWQVLQVIDSAFPTGGFAHSSGLEAAVQLGDVRTSSDVDGFLRSHLWNAGASALPFVAAAHDAPGDWPGLDEAFDATLINHVANRASRTQGRAFLSTCERVFSETALAAMALRAREPASPAHLAPSFGACLRVLGAGRREALALYLYVSLRGVVSAAVRMGALGPLEAQRLQSAHGATLDAVLCACERVRTEDAATVAPLLEIMGARHDRLYSRLFQS